MSHEQSESDRNVEADFNVRWRNGLLAAGFSEEEISEGVEWSDARLKDVDLSGNVTTAEIEEEKSHMYGYLEQLRLSDSARAPSRSRRIGRASLRHSWGGMH